MAARPPVPFPPIAAGPLGGGAAAAAAVPIMPAQQPDDYPRLGGNSRPMGYYTLFYNEHGNVNSTEADYWTGGTQTGDNTIVQLAQPTDMLAHRPTDFKAMQRIDGELKKGLPEERQLELAVNGKMKTPVMTWVSEIKHIIHQRGMEAVFSIRIDRAGTITWQQLLDNFGDVTIAQMQASKTWSKSTPFNPALRVDTEGHFDRFDKENLRLSGIAIRNSLGPNLLQRVSSLIGPGETGPIVFKTALDQVMHMNASTIRVLSNTLGSLSLKEQPGESVSTLTEKVTELAREIEGSGKAPTDLKNLISKPHTKGAVESFRAHALNVHNSIMRGTHNEDWQSMVTGHNNFYQDLVQSDEYPPAKGGKSDQDETIQGLIAKTVDQKLSKLKIGSNGGGGGGNDGNNNGRQRKCFGCGSTDHIVKNCPFKDKDNADNKGDDNGNKETSWRHKPPKKNESHEKTVDGKTHKWGGKCRGNNGLWTTGKYLHSTAEHRPKKTNTDEPKNDEEGKLAYMDEPLEFGFIGVVEDLSNSSYKWCCEVASHPKGCCRNH